MKKIKNIEKITARFPSWKPSDIAFFRNLTWTGNDLIISAYAQLRDGGYGWPNPDKDFFGIAMCFKNVSNLKLDFSDSGLQQVSGFDILDISTNGFEKTNFQIEDYENGVISFNCEEVQIVEDVIPSVRINLNY